nr:nucleolar and coiled-body phosphoprotein 1-like [Aegilops tauschii subsp. strangulata]
MPDLNAHGLDPNWVEPDDLQVQSFFNTLHERYVTEEPQLIQDTSPAELDYMATRVAEAQRAAEEAALAEAAGSAGGVEDKAVTTAEEEELARWARAAVEVSNASTGAPLVEDAGDGPSGEEEEDGAGNPSAPRRRRLRRATSSGPVRPVEAARRPRSPVEPVRQAKAAAAKKVVKAAVAMRKASASSSSKHVQTPPSSPPLASTGGRAEFKFGTLSPPRKRKAAEEKVDHEDVETLAQRVKRAKASASGQHPAGTSGAPLVVLSSPDSSPRHSPQRKFLIPPRRHVLEVRRPGADLAGCAGGEQRQEEPQSATPNAPPLSTTSLRGASPARAPNVEPTRMEEEENLGTGGSTSAPGVGGEETSASQPDPFLTDREDLDTVIGDVAKDAAAEAEKIVAEEAGMDAAEEAGKATAEGAGKATAEEAGKGPAAGAGEAATEETGKGPAGEASAAAAEEEEEVAVDRPSSSAAPGPGRYLRVSDDLFVHLPGAPSTRAPVEGEVFDGEVLAAVGLEVVDEPSGELAKRDVELAMKLADVEKAQEVAKNLAAATEAARRHREALDAEALVYAGSVEELEAERDGLKDQALRLAEEKDTLNGALTEEQGAILVKAEQLSTANDSIKDLTSKLEALEGILSEAKAREGTLAKALETERQLRKDEAAIHKDFMDAEDRWIGLLEDVADKITAQLATMGMPTVRYAREHSGSTRAKLTLFFEVVLGALEQLQSNRESTLADESRHMCLGAMTKVLTKLAFRYPGIDFNDAVDSLPDDAVLSGIEERIKPVTSHISGIERVEGQRRD